MNYGRDVDPEPEDAGEAIERDARRDAVEEKAQWDREFEDKTGEPVDRGPVDDDEADIGRYLSQRGRK